MIIPETVKIIETYAISGCNLLESIVIMGSLDTIGDYGITNCPRLSYAYYYSTSAPQVSGTGIMTGCGVSSFYVFPDFVGEIEGITMTKPTHAIGEVYVYVESTKALIYGKGKMPEDLTYSQPWEQIQLLMTTVRIEYGVTSISTNAFSHSDGYQITSIKIAKTVSTFGMNAFLKCDAMTAVFYPNVFEPSSSSNTELPCSGNPFCDANGQIPSSKIFVYVAKKYQNDADGFLKLTNTRIPLETGSCGGACKWTVYNDGYMNIKGDNEMTDYSETKRPGWYEYR